MTLEAECALVGQLDTLKGAVEQRLVNGANIARQRGLINSKTVVLAGDHDHTGVQILNRMVCTVVAMAHFHGLGTGSQGQKLVTQADTEYRHFGLQHFLIALMA